MVLVVYPGQGGFFIQVENVSFFSPNQSLGAGLKLPKLRNLKKKKEKVWVRTSIVERVFCALVSLKYLTSR